MMIRPGNLLR